MITEEMHIGTSGGRLWPDSQGYSASSPSIGRVRSLSCKRAAPLRINHPEAELRGRNDPSRATLSKAQ